MDKLIITDLQFHAHCGITSAEQEAGQRLSLDLELYIDLKKSSTADALLALPDYGHVANVVVEVGRKERFNLLESLADHIARILIKQFPVDEVVLRVKKLHPPVEAIQGYFGVEIRRRATKNLPKSP
jgi:dihydroneopterin aldolase